MEREAEAQDTRWRARLDAVLMHRIWGSLIFLCIVYIIFFLSFALGDPLVRLIQTGTQLFSVWACHMLEPWPRLQSLLGEGVVGGVGGVLAFLPNVVLLFGAITLLENSGYMMRVSRLMGRIMKIMGLNGSSFAPLLLGFGCSVPAILSTRRIGARNDRLVTIAVLPMMSCAGRLPIYMMFVSALFPAHLQATVLFGIYAGGVLLALCCARLLKNTLFKAEPRDSFHHMKRLRLPSLRKVGVLMWSRAFMYVRKAGTFILGASIILWFLNTYPRPEEGTAPHAAAAMEHSYAGQIGHWMEPITQVAGFDWKINSALLGAFAAKEIFVTQMGILYAVEDGDSGPAAQQTLNARLKANYTPPPGHQHHDILSDRPALHRHRHRRQTGGGHLVVRPGAIRRPDPAGIPDGHAGAPGGVVPVKAGRGKHGRRGILPPPGNEGLPAFEAGLSPEQRRETFPLFFHGWQGAGASCFPPAGEEQNPTAFPGASLECRRDLPRCCPQSLVSGNGGRFPRIKKPEGRSSLRFPDTRLPKPFKSS